MNQTLCVGYFTLVIMRKFGHSTLIQERLTEQCFNNPQCVIYLIMVHSGSFMICLFNKSDAMC